MLMSKLFFETLRDDPTDADIISHKLMIRASLMRKLVAGIYSFLPLGFRVIKKVEDIIREEMNKSGAQELLMPALQPKELWEETGRWKVYGPELMRLKDRNGRDFCLGPTHEEIITDLVKNHIKSYRQLPINLYQIQTKFRDETRPRFGVIRAREFIMKDAYSFGKNEQDLNEEYEKMYQTYTNIFKRCGLNFRAVEATTGAIGGDVSHEFIVLTEAGEEVIFYCSSCNYAANKEKAESRIQDTEYRIPDEEMKTPKKIYTPNIKTVEQLTSFLNITPDRLLKTLIYKTDKEIIAALIFGDDELNEVKLQKLLDDTTVEMADPLTIEKITQSAVGFAGPMGLNITIVADKKIPLGKNFITGANKTNYHLINVNIGRDFTMNKIGDITFAKVGEKCPRCEKGKLLSCRGIEVGQIFKLGTKYSQALKCIFSEVDGKDYSIIMGCYGIGITRTVAAIIEQNNDESGIIWPLSVAPYQVIVIPVNSNNSEQFNTAKEIYNNLRGEKIETLFDDREVRPGVKFKDADLIGIPIKVIVGDKFIQNAKVEIKLRKDKKAYLENPEEAIGKIKELI